MMKRWHAPQTFGYMVYNTPEFSVVCPITDIKPHDVYSKDCPCKPEVSFYEYTHLVHHSFEETEALETHLKGLGL